MISNLSVYILELDLTSPKHTYSLQRNGNELYIYILCLPKLHALEFWNTEPLLSDSPLSVHYSTLT